MQQRFNILNKTITRAPSMRCSQEMSFTVQITFYGFFASIFKAFVLGTNAITEAYTLFQVRVFSIKYYLEKVCFRKDVL